MRLHQLNLKFDPEQDRLLLRINTSTQLELRLWLTRRLTVGVLPLVRRLVAEQVVKVEALEAVSDTALMAKDPKIREFLSEIKKDTILKNSDFSTPFKEQAPSPTPAQSAAPVDDPVLVSEMALTPLTNGHLKIKFTGKAGGSAQSRDVQIDLDDKLMHGFLHLLEKSYATSEWATAAVASVDNEAASDKTANTGRPQYLN
jgi:hypothetical protein